MGGRRDKKYCSNKCRNMANNDKKSIDDQPLKISLTLKNVPQDIYNLLVDKQAEMKKKIGANFGLEATIYKLIRESIKN
jgi:hypothetical protein